MSNTKAIKDGLGDLRWRMESLECKAAMDISNAVLKDKPHQTVTYYAGKVDAIKECMELLSYIEKST